MFQKITLESATLNLASPILILRCSLWQKAPTAFDSFCKNTGSPLMSMHTSLITSLNASTSGVHFNTRIKSELSIMLCTLSKDRPDRQKVTWDNTANYSIIAGDYAMKLHHNNLTCLDYKFRESCKNRV